MTTPTTPEACHAGQERVLRLLVESLEAERAWKQPEMGDESTARRLLYAQQAIQALDPAHLRQLAQAHAEQQARLRGLVEKWRGRAMVDRSYGRTVNASTYEKCADELETVLGGKENESTTHD